MDYIEKWMKMKAQCKQQEKAVISIYSFNSSYGFKLNINHPAIGKKYEDFQKAKGISRHSSFLDNYRREFEEKMMKSKYFQKLAAMEAKQYGAAYEYVMMHGSLPDKLEDIA